MKLLTQAIYTKWTATSDLTTNISGGLYFDEVVVSQTRPYCRYSIVNGTSDYTFGSNDELEETRIQFDIYGTGANAVMALQDKLHTAFDDVMLTISGESMYQAMRINQWVRLDSRDENNDEIYRAMSEYRFKVMR